jgi:hypothetical protein
MEVDPSLERDRAIARRIQAPDNDPDCPACAETTAMLFWALLASGQITMRKVDGRPRREPDDQIIDLPHDRLAPCRRRGAIQFQHKSRRDRWSALDA